MKGKSQVIFFQLDSSFSTVQFSHFHQQRTWKVERNWVICCLHDKTSSEEWNKKFHISPWDLWRRWVEHAEVKIEKKSSNSNEWNIHSSQKIHEKRKNINNIANQNQMNETLLSGYETGHVGVWTMSHVVYESSIIHNPLFLFFHRHHLWMCINNDDILDISLAFSVFFPFSQHHKQQQKKIKLEAERRR